MSSPNPDPPSPADTTEACQDTQFQGTEGTIDDAKGIYCGEFLPDTGTMHGFGKWTGKGVDTGRSYTGEWSHGQHDGRGIYEWPDGGRYEGEYRQGMRSGSGILWLPGRGRCFDGTWAQDHPLRGTALDSDRGLYRCIFDGKLSTLKGWHKAERSLAGRLVGGRPAKGGDGGGRGALWAAVVELDGGRRYAGPARGLAPCGTGWLFGPGGPPGGVRVVCDGRAGFGEGPAWEVRGDLRGRPAAARDVRGAPTWWRRRGRGSPSA